MFTHEELSTVLHSLVTGMPARAVALVEQSPTLSQDQRDELAKRLTQPLTPSEGARAVGDTLRSWEAPRDLVHECYRAAFYASDAPVQLSRNQLFAHFLAKKGGLVLDKWPHYFRVYDRYLSGLRGTSARVLEIGVYRGGGLDLLRDYLGPQAHLVGIDIDPVAVDVASARHVVELGDQTDPEFLARVVDEHGPFDVVIDDGGHTMTQQIATAQVLLPRMPAGSVYIVEDCHTSYWPEYDGGRGGEGTFLEWVKDLLDEVNTYHWSTDVDPDHLGVSIDAVHVHDSVVVLDVGRPFAPFPEVVGTWDFLKLSRPLSAIHSELLATRDATAHLNAKLTEDLAESRRQAAREHHARREAYAQLEAVRGSVSWRTTSLLRRLRRRGDS